MSDTLTTSTQSTRAWPRWMRGTLSTLGACVPWGGRFCGRLLQRFRTPERYANGLVIVLPGIESESFLNHSVVWGLHDGGWSGAIELHDWTTTNTLLFLYHLRGWRRNLRQARQIADRIVAYQQEYPGRPVHMIGHSGGGAMTVLVLESLPENCQISAAILLASALGPEYPLQTALSRTEFGLWNFWSPLDMFFLGGGTLMLGTIDGKLSVASGLVGFRPPAGQSLADQKIYEQRLHQQGYVPRMAATFNLGGHFGCTNRAFIEKWIAPLITEPGERPA